MYSNGVRFRDTKKRIFCHRGIWAEKEDQNTLKAIQAAAKEGFGVETDLNHLMGEVCISHDVPRDPNTLKFSKIAELEVPIALNLKCDGLLHQLSKYLVPSVTSESFVFDGSIPEMYKYRSANFPHALRISEFEKNLPWRPEVLWIDAFEGEWWQHEFSLIRNFGVDRIVFVSPELHGRDPRLAWRFLATIWNSDDVEVSICTDKPFEFMEQL